MTVLKRFRVTWAGAPVVGPGLSTFYESPGSTPGFADALVDFFTALKDAFPTGIQWQIPASGDFITAETGVLEGSWSDPGTGGTVVSGSGTAFANGVGGRLVWNTNGVFSGRRVRGSTFLVPLIDAAHEGAGNLTSGTLTAFQSAGDALVAASDEFGIWSRPNNIAGNNGEFNLITSCLAPDKISWLRGRRT